MPEAFDWVFPPRADAPAAEWLEAPLPAPRRRPAPPGVLVLHPTVAQLDWHHARSRLYAGFLGRPPLAHFGARTARGTAWWTAQFKSDELLVLVLDAPDAGDAAPLIHAAQHAAHRAGLPKVRVWETFPLASVPGGRRLPREGELPMAVPLNARFEAWAHVERAFWV